MKQKNHRLNSVSAGTEAVMNVVLALFSLCCIIPFIFVVIISFSSEESIRTIGYSFWPMAWSTDTYAYAFVCDRSKGVGPHGVLHPDRWVEA